MNKPMKLVALLPFKNEEWILPTYLKNVLPLVDMCIAIDDGSTDNGRAILEQHEKVKVYDNNSVLDTNEHWTEFSMRQKLLEFGRQFGGTHFLCLDADEALSTNFLRIAKQAIGKLEPGHKLALQWLPMWKGTTHYRDDNSIWCSIWKDFIVCDKPGIDYPFTEFGVTRTPGMNTEAQWLKLKQEHGVCMHFSFSRWEHFQVKSCWYRCGELIKHPTWLQAINEKYRITLDTPSIVKEMPKNWVDGIPMPFLDDNSPPLLLKEIDEYFTKYGVDYFKDLDIWHVPSIRKLADNQKRKQ